MTQTVESETPLHPHDPRLITHTTGVLALTSPEVFARLPKAWRLRPTKGATFADETPMRLPGSCRGPSCCGHHVDYPDAERPKLEGVAADEVVRRILATPMWKGATAERATCHHPNQKTQVPLDCTILRHPSGAVATLYHEVPAK